MIPQSSHTEIPGSLQRGIRYLLDHQSEDGAWRSRVYGHFREGDALTPLIIVGLQRCPSSPETDEAIRKGQAWLMKPIGRDGSIDPAFTLSYPVYTAALGVRALSAPSPQETAARTAWLRLLQSWQMTEDLGWQKTDRQYGGWGYSGVVPHKPQREPIPEAIEANLSATAYALEAMRPAAGLPDADLMRSRARIFVERCQNFAELPSEVDDGGFFFAPNDPFRNKAGTLRDADGKLRYRSYGCATADGLRCLIALGVPHDHPRFQAALGWLKSRRQENPRQHPGRYAADRETDRDGPFFYYAAGLAKAAESVNLPDLQDELIGRQRADGSWRNDCNQVREDDPLLATALAVYALTR